MEVASVESGAVLELLQERRASDDASTAQTGTAAGVAVPARSRLQSATTREAVDVSDIAGLRVDLPAETLEQIVELVAARVAARPVEQPGGWLNAARAAEYLSVPRRRIYDLKSMGVLEPDGYDGRTPLWRRESLDAYAMSARP